MGRQEGIQGTFKSNGETDMRKEASKQGAIEHPSWQTEDNRWEKHGTKQTRMMGGKMEGEFMGKKSHSFQVDRLTLSAADPGVGLVTGPYGAYHYG